MSVKVNIERIEFVVTHLCSGRCRHCSAAGELNRLGCVSAEVGERAIFELCEGHPVTSMMTFGGEALLYPETTCRLHAAAREAGIGHRQLITNGCFSKDPDRVHTVARRLRDSGVNEVLLSADGFHQEYLPEEMALSFARELMALDMPSLEVHPSWIGGPKEDNAPNRATRRILARFERAGIAIGDGNIIFPAGNAIRYLGAYFDPPGKVDFSQPCGSAPYTDRPSDVRCISIEPNGDVMLCFGKIGNLYEAPMHRILDAYDPYGDERLTALMAGGAAGLIAYARDRGIRVDTEDCYSACMACKRAMEALDLLQ